jgi:ketosteroid isomerase-like protein
MSEENAEAIRRVYERWAEGDFSGGGLEVFDPEIEFVLPPTFPESGTYRGPEEIAEYMREFLEPWVRITISVEELDAAGDTVTAHVVQSGVGSGSGVPTELRYVQVWTFRDGRAIRLENIRDRPI